MNYEHRQDNQTDGQTDATQYREPAKSTHSMLTLQMYIISS